MFRFLIVCICVIGYLILSIPILIVEWIVGKFNKRAKDISSLRIIQTVFKFVLKVTGAKITIIGHENVPTNQAVLYIGNHRSFFDILLTYTLCPDLTGYIAKKEMEPIPLLSTWTVSYTHLDVYKRQSQRKQHAEHYRSHPENIHTLQKISRNSDACHKFNHGIPTVLISSNSKASLKPVSYTHLDVYKRQIWAPIRCP